MRILSRIIFVAMLAMAVIIIPLGAATIIMAIELGLFFEALSGMLIQRPLYERFGYRLDGRYRLLVLRQHWLQANQICRRKMLLEEV